MDAIGRRKRLAIILALCGGALDAAVEVVGAGPWTWPLRLVAFSALGCSLLILGRAGIRRIVNRRRAALDAANGWSVPSYGKEVVDDILSAQDLERTSLTSLSDHG